MWEERVLTPEPRGDEGGRGEVVSKMQRSTLPPLVFSLTLSSLGEGCLTYTHTPGPLAHAQFPFPCGRSGIYFPLGHLGGQIFPHTELLKRDRFPFQDSFYVIRLEPQARVSSQYPVSALGELGVFLPRSADLGRSEGQKPQPLRSMLSLNLSGWPVCVSQCFKRKGCGT